MQRTENPNFFWFSQCLHSVGLHIGWDTALLYSPSPAFAQGLAERRSENPKRIQANPLQQLIAFSSSLEFQIIPIIGCKRKWNGHEYQECTTPTVDIYI
jgi:hypothetical protein